MNTIEQEFQSFIAACYPDGTSPEQLRQLRNAFFGGSACAIVNVVSAANNQPEEVAAAYSQSLLNEAAEHVAAVMRRHLYQN